MDIHRQIAAWMSIGFGALRLLLALFFVLIFGGVSHFMQDNGEALQFFAAIGGALLGFFSIFSIADILAGAFYLRGSPVAKVWLVISNALSLLVFPVGTVLGAYSLWAILRDLPEFELNSTGQRHDRSHLDFQSGTSFD